MLVCYVVVAYNSGAIDRCVDTSVPGNVIMCGVARDMMTAKSIVAKNEKVYGARNIVIYNAVLS